MHLLSPDMALHQNYIPLRAMQSGELFVRLEKIEEKQLQTIEIQDIKILLSRILYTWFCTWILSHLKCRLCFS